MLRASSDDLPDDWREQIAAAISLCSGRAEAALAR